MTGEALPGTALAEWLERIRKDPQAVADTRARIEALMRDPTVAARVRDGLSARRSAAGEAPVGPGWLSAFLRDSDGALSFQMRFGGAGRRLARLRQAAFAGASADLIAFCPE